MKPEHWRSMLAVISGMILAASDWPVRLTYLHYVALVPILAGYLAFPDSTKFHWRSGFLFASTYGILLALSAATTIPVWIALLWGMVHWTLVWGLVGSVLHHHWLLGPLVSAAIVTLAELLVWHVIPIFGMAQCFARVTSVTPWAVQFAAYTGLGGVVFALVFSQSLLASILLLVRRSDPDRLKKCAVLIVFLASLGAVNYLRWHRPLGPELRVAAFGWAGEHQLSLSQMCNDARAASAEILVTPELGFGIGEVKPEENLHSLADDIRQSNIKAAIGVARLDLRENQALLIDANEIDTYTKTHLIPFMENSRSGQGRRVIKHWSEVRCGVMICQDDNFSDLARGYSRDGAQLMLVPTLDWNPICGLHFESSVMRAIENGYAICRGASGGISALITPKGQVLKSHNHNLQRDALCISDALPVGDGRSTLYARLGDWPIGILSAAICVLSLVLRRVAK